MRAWYCVIALVGGALVGCSTGAQIEAIRMRTKAAETQAAAMSCFDKVNSKADYAPLRAKMYLGLDNNFPLQFTTDQSRPTKQEIALLYKFHGDIQACRKIDLEGFAQVHPLIMLTLVGVLLGKRQGVGRGCQRAADLGTVQPTHERHRC